MPTKIVQFTREKSAKLSMEQYVEAGYKITRAVHVLPNGLWAFEFNYGYPQNFDWIRKTPAEIRAPRAFTIVHRPPKEIQGHEHGKWSTYCTKKCRCVLCVEAAHQYQHERYLRKKGILG